MIRIKPAWNTSGRFGHNKTSLEPRFEISITEEPMKRLRVSSDSIPDLF